MSHTYKDAETGIIFHYNSDLSGDVSINIPGRQTKKVPGEALRRFIMQLAVREEMLEDLTRFVRWLYEVAGLEQPILPKYPEPPTPPIPTEEEVTQLAIERDRAQSRWLEAAQRRTNALDVQALIKSCCLLRKAGEWSEDEGIFLFHDFPADEVQGILDVLATMDTSDIEGDIP